MEPMFLDVREDLRAGREPLPRIMQAVRGLAAGQGLVLRTTFEPIPLYRVLGVKGYSHEARRLESGDWEIVFVPGERRGLFGRKAKAEPKAPPPPQAEAEPKAPPPPQAEADWAEPVRTLDNRGLLPPEPMIRILGTLEEMGPGQVLEAFNDREPQFLFPELEARGHLIRVEKREDGARLLIRHA